MSLSSKETMRWILFWVFVGTFTVVTILTILAVFFDLGSPSEDERKLLLNVFILETGAAVAALFYSLFKLRGNLDSDADDVDGQVEKHFKKISEPLDKKVEDCTAGVLMVQAELEGFKGNHSDSAISYLHALSHAINCDNASLSQEIVSLFKSDIIPKLTREEFLACRELKSDLDRLVVKMKENNKSNRFDNFIRELSDYLGFDVDEGSGDNG